MKKRLIILFALLILVFIGNSLFFRKKTETVTVPEEKIEVSETVEEEEQEPASELTEETSDEEDEDYVNPYPYWWELYDYNAEQEVLASDGEFKNLTIQPGDEQDQIRITWFSRSGSHGKVVFQTDGLFNNISANATTEASISVPGYYRNSALIDGLESNTCYTYYLTNGSSQSPTYEYVTQDLYSTDFTFTIAGDPEIGLGDADVLSGQRSIWRVMLNRMKAEIPESSFLITTGDQVADPASSVHYDYFLDNSVLYSTPLVPLVGNHDSGTGYFGDHFSLPNMSSIGTAQGRDGDYWFVRGNALFMVLNSMCPEATEVHEQFVAQAIEANPDAKWRIVVSHYSPITMVERYQGVRESIKYVYDYMADVFDIDLFLGGHDHIYTRGYFLDEDGEPLEGQEVEYEFHNPEEPIYVVFNGATDALLREPDEDYPWSAVTVQNGVPQLSEVHVTEDSITVTTHDADSWLTVDSFTIYKD